MRLDLFLKVSRIVLRRTLAQKLCDAGLVKINRIPAKSSREVKANDELELLLRNRKLHLKVLQVPQKKQVSREEASRLYEVLAEETLDEAIDDSIFEIQEIQ